MRLKESIEPIDGVTLLESSKNSGKRALNDRTSTATVTAGITGKEKKPTFQVAKKGKPFTKMT